MAFELSIAEGVLWYQEINLSIPVCRIQVTKRSFTKFGAELWAVKEKLTSWTQNMAGDVAAVQLQYIVQLLMYLTYNLTNTIVYSE